MAFTPTSVQDSIGREYVYHLHASRVSFSASLRLISRFLPRIFGKPSKEQSPLVHSYHLKSQKVMQMKSQLPQYTYESLKPGEIRLLKPANPDDGLSWTIEIASIDAASLEFDALSYTWGSQSQTFPIACNGLAMRVHHNLHTTLPYLARRSGNWATRPIWVDAVCINQADNDEKQVQIRLMNTLYRRAKKVWVWLGCASLRCRHISHAPLR